MRLLFLSALTGMHLNHEHPNSSTTAKSPNSLRNRLSVCFKISCSPSTLLLFLSLSPVLRLCSPPIHARFLFLSLQCMPSKTKPLISQAPGHCDHCPLSVSQLLRHAIILLKHLSVHLATVVGLHHRRPSLGGNYLPSGCKGSDPCCSYSHVLNPSCSNFPCRPSYEKALH